MCRIFPPPPPALISRIKGVVPWGCSPGPSASRDPTLPASSGRPAPLPLLPLDFPGELGKREAHARANSSHSGCNFFKNMALSLGEVEEGFVGAGMPL